MANLTERAMVIRATQWELDDGTPGCTIYVLREAANSGRVVGYALPKINASAEVFVDFEEGAGIYELELSADLNGSRPRVRCVGAKFVEPLIITSNGSDNSK